MAAITYKSFRGSVPRFSGRLQTPNFALYARNVKLASGRLDPLLGLQLVYTSPLAAEIKSIWRYRHYKQDRTIEDNWLVFASDVDVVRSSIANDEFGMVYWTSLDHEPRMAPYSLAVSGVGNYPGAAYTLGLPSPKRAMGTSIPKPGLSLPPPPANPTLSTRSYCWTWVDASGAESGPSPATTRTYYENEPWDFSFSIPAQVLPENSSSILGVLNNIPSAGYVTIEVGGLVNYTRPGDELTISGVLGMTDLNGKRLVTHVNANPGLGPSNISFKLTTAQTYTSGGTWARVAPFNTDGMMRRIYRTEGGGANFFFRAEIAPGSSWTDAAPTDDDVVGELLPTLKGQPPPTNLHSIVSLPNGCMVGLVENEVCFSDPFMPYSWPIENRYSFTGKGIALVPSANSVIVLTDSYPVLLTGSDPESMSASVMETYAPCVSKRGAVNVGGGALYPSFDGLWLITLGNIQNMTKRLYREEDWKLLGPSTFDACFHDGQYYANHRPLGASLDEVLVLNVAELDSAVTVEVEASAMHRNEFDGEMYVARGNKIYRWDTNDNERFFGEWTSVDTQLDQPRNFSHAQVHAMWEEVVPPDTRQLDANQALIDAGADAVTGFVLGNELLDVELNGSLIVPIEPSTERSVQFTIYGEGGIPIFSRKVTDSRPFRLPAGVKYEVVRVGLNASVGVYSVTIAESTAELAQAST
jgi:hypothetical protein